MTLYVIVPGPLDQRTGGYLYDARMVDGLRGLGWHVEVRELDGSFPDVDATARAALDGALASCPDGSSVVIDGLAMGGLPDPIRRHGERLRIVSLVHHPLADETGLTPEEQRRFIDSERAALEPCTGVIVTSAFTAGRSGGVWRARGPDPAGAAGNRAGASRRGARAGRTPETDLRRHGHAAEGLRRARRRALLRARPAVELRVRRRGRPRPGLCPRGDGADRRRGAREPDRIRRRARSGRARRAVPIGLALRARVALRRVRHGAHRGARARDFPS